ncbi:MAG: sugar transferase [Armatimonadota bacterium]|jgi:lipopolysaccharide/colanic/teichoic acid biosynthesis glycosyltransferase
MSSTISTKPAVPRPPVVDMEVWPADVAPACLSTRSRFYTRSKRIGDVALALIGLIFTLPLWGFIALAIKLSSPGPVFFRQKRPGKGCVPFEILKFRTMVPNAEDRLAEVVDVNDTEDPLIRVEHDPRVTGVGHLLRVTSLDELPQLVNVLRGDMSLVGPRPISRPILDPRNRVRLQVTPGLTGLWQISGRKNSDTNYMLTKDMEYLEKRSLMFDCGILVKTVLAVLRADGAR